MPQLTIHEAFNLAVKHHQAGRLAEAQEIYQQILDRQPDHAAACINLGTLLRDRGLLAEAVTAYRALIARRPILPEAYCHLGAALADMGRLDEAISADRQAIALRSDYAEAHSNLGAALAKTGELDEAIAAFGRTIALRPDSAEAHRNLGLALATKGELDEAFAAYQVALSLNPNFSEALVDLGNICRDQGRFDDATAAYRRAIAVAPDFADAHNNLGVVLRYRGLPDEAIALFRHAVALRPGFAEAHSNLGIALADEGRFDESLAESRQAIAIRPDYATAHSTLVYGCHFHPAFDARAIAEEHRIWEQLHAVPLRSHIKPHLNDRDPDRRLRIGYVSPDFREHPVGRFLLPLLENHDRRRFEIFAYSQSATSDAMSERFRGHTDAWRSITYLTITRAADLIRQDRIDILVDLTLHMAHNRLLVFALKPAPVQVTYLAYAGSSGLSTIDYRLSDPYLDPPGGDESVYSEKTVRLPETYWCYQPVVDLPLVPPPAMKNGFVTFGCLNNFWKVNEPLLDIWARILSAVPGSRLILHAHQGSHRQRTTNFLQVRGIEPARVSFAGSVPKEAYFNRYQSIDIALDTVPYGGGTTTCDALWMGVPVISLVGKTAVGRGGLSILSNIGLPELVAPTPEEYVKTAVNLAGDIPRLTELRSTLRQRMETSPLMDAPGFARNVEAVYRGMWRTWCETGANLG